MQRIEYSVQAENLNSDWYIFYASEKYHFGFVIPFDWPKGTKLKAYEYPSSYCCFLLVKQDHFQNHSHLQDNGNLNILGSQMNTSILDHSPKLSDPIDFPKKGCRCLAK